MNILLSMPNDGQTNKYIINALFDLGHDVFYIDHRMNLEECKRVVPMFFKYHKIDLFLVLHLIKGQTYDINYLRSLKTRFPYIKQAAWFLDGTTKPGVFPYDDIDFVALAKEYDYFFTVALGQIEEYKKKGINAQFVPDAFDIYTPKFNFNFKYDVSFIGQVGLEEVHPNRLSTICSLIDVFDNFKIYGPVYTQEERILKHHSLRVTYNEIHHSKVVSQSKINLGIFSWPNIKLGLSARVYRIMGAGGFHLTTKVDGLEEFFEEDKEIVMYSSIEECIDKIKYYLKYSEERNKIAQRGYEKVINNYTFHHSLRKLLSFVNKEKI